MSDELHVRVPENPNEVSEGEWISYFLQAREPELEDYTAVDLVMKQLKMKTTFPDVASRMGQLRADMHHILDKHTVGQVMLEREQKKVVNTHFKRVQVVTESRAETDGSKATTPNQSLRRSVGLREDDGTAQTTIDGFTLQTSLLDIGADDSVVSGGIVRP
ncbi:unnamed protein product [Phytophthora fragariaefolia]|uniref:Unnamed protein product n=1 Tax=Phytophthora fragariaefolia TaxID=1490495 RepID=A0A9W6Y9U3_9STRA|nr:unnamed protein product [Phytophthora fragariaefolia]